MGMREATVNAGKEGHFSINGTPGILTLTAGGNKDDGALHYYTIDRTEKEDEDTSVFVKRTVSIASGESYVLDNLPKGGYTVKEYTVEAGEKYKVTFPETKELPGSGKSSGLSWDSGNRFVSMGITYPKDFDVDYIKMVSFGPLYNSKDKMLNNTTSYAAFRYGISDGKNVTNIRHHKTGYTGDKTVTIKDAPKLEMDATKKLAFTATGVKSTSATKIGVRWIAYDETITEKTFDKASIKESVTVDEHKWMKIEAPVLNDPDAVGADQIVYYYEIRDDDGDLVQGETDIDGTTVKLLPGESKELQLPAAGSYTIVEGIKGSTAAGFAMKVEGYPFGTTEAGKSIKVQVGGERAVTISKPALGSHPAGSEDNRTYIFTVDGAGFTKEVKVKAGESGTVTLPKEGKYTITPQNDAIGAFGLNYTDSGAVYGTASGSTGTITFTNSFSPGEYGYRYIHEYYVREADGNYTYEGNSQITTRLGREENEKYTSRNISQAPNFNENTYKHFEEAYGWVDPITSAVSVQAEPDERFPADSPGETNEDMDSTEPVPSDEDTSDISDTMDDKEPAPSDEDILDSAGSEEAEVPDDAAGSDDIDNGTPVSPGENVPDTADSGESRTSDGEMAGDEGTVYQNGRSVVPYSGNGIVSEGTGLASSGLNTEDTIALRYGSDSAKEHIDVARDASQIIILRYYREPDKEGSYNIIHEYYTREAGGSQDIDSDTFGPGRALWLQNDDSEIGEGEEDASDIFTGTLNRSRNDGYVYTYEGSTHMKPVTASLSSTHTAKKDDWELTYGGNSYTYIEAGYGTKSDDDSYNCNPNQQWAASTEKGDEVVILRYYREADDPSLAVSYKVVHEYYVRDKEGKQTLAGTSDIREVTDASSGVYYTQDNVKQEPVFQGNTYTYFDWGCGTVSEQSYSEISGKQFVLATASGEQIIILRYVREEAPKGPETSSEDHGASSEGTESAGRKDSAADTGDDGRVVLWILLSAGSLCVLASRSVVSRRRRYNREL